MSSAPTSGGSGRGGATGSPTLGAGGNRLSGSDRSRGRASRRLIRARFLGVHEDEGRYDTFLNLRVADIQAVYDEWRERGANFITPPLDNQEYELRCYLRDPGGRIIEGRRRDSFRTLSA